MILLSVPLIDDDHLLNLFVSLRTNINTMKSMSITPTNTNGAYTLTLSNRIPPTFEIIIIPIELTMLFKPIIVPLVPFSTTL